MNLENIRNFSIIAHIDHGKSTLADRILEHTNSVIGRDKRDQILDSMDLEQERGVTIKLNAVQLKYKDYTFHLIDTPGHVDFSYEVSRSLAACEGAILVVDASQGIEAQTLANVYLALERDLTIIPVINKIDLPNADVEKVKKEIVDTFGFMEEEILLVSAKENIGIKELLDAIVDRIPAPKSNNDKLQALIFDSEYESYRGVICLVRVVNGKIKIRDKIKMLSTGATYEVVELGVYTPEEQKREELNAGEVGYITAAIRNIKDIKVGDTITLERNPTNEVLIGYRAMKPMVYCGLFPIDSKKYGDLKEALEKLQLNDAALIFEPETSESLGFGFRVGFLGMFHMDIIEERIEREFNIDLIATSPSVIYEVTTNDLKVTTLQNPTDMPDRVNIKEIKEPYIYTNIIVFSDYIGPVMDLCQNKRGTFINMEYITTARVNIHYEMPLSEIVYDFFDKLKSYTKGYASFDYEVIGYRASDLIKLEILINGEKVDALSTIVHKDFAYKRGKTVVDKLKDIIPRQQFEVPIQASIGSKIIARSDIKAMRKNVLAKCYGGDVSRKKKLLEKQKEGKKRMKTIGSVEIPQEAFLSVLSMDEE
ncbi:MAG: translation elongation factor 4 [Bacilli bacterium]|nr:translation elongation factor 4 [Bacilli bacterium]MDD4624166.1 translation elongation factor 4 [Bacilli bacterium]MDD4831701.1 translation elongation factor 4 [Bacilli bacterium]